jgi:hypothetical protein
MSADLVAEMVSEVWKAEKTQNLLQKLEVPMDEEQNPPQPHIENFTKSMWVEFVDMRGKRNTLLPHFNVFADSSLIPNKDLWCQTRLLLARRPYTAIRLGRGTVAIALFNCGICHGATHPRGLCPFPEIPGWNGPARHPDNQYNNRGGNGRGGSNRGGRGRGTPSMSNNMWN